MADVATFPGFRRAVGPPGIRNTVLVLSITGLTNPAARRIAAQVRGTHVIAMPYSTGLINEDREVHLRALEGLACNPNVGAVLIISDNVPKAKSLGAGIDARGQRVEMALLDHEGQDAISLVAMGTRLAAKLVREVSGQLREDMPLSALNIGLKCGRSDPSSGLMANPATGHFIDGHVDAGGTAIFGEVVEWLGAEELLAARACDPAIAAQLRNLPAEREVAAIAAGLDLTGNNPSPTNIAAGLSSIEEKSLGGISKTGTGQIKGVLDYAKAPGEPGLFAMDTPNYAPEHLTALAAAGCQMALFTTGAGNSFVSGLIPTLKVCANRSSCDKLKEQFDVTLDDLLDQNRPATEGGTRIAKAVLDTAAGRLTWGEILGEGDDIVSRFGAAL